MPEAPPLPRAVRRAEDLSEMPEEDWNVDARDPRPADREYVAGEALGGRAGRALFGAQERI
jgi:hypothetical protein